MDIRRNLKTNWITLKRSYFFWIICLIDYIFLALYDTKTFLSINSYEQAIYRYNMQQFFIVLTIIFLVQPVFSEKTLRIMRNYMMIYNKNLKTEIYGVLLLNSIVNIVGFLSGQIILLLINIFASTEIYSDLWGVNMFVVVMEIQISLFLIMGLRLIFRKDMLVYSIFFMIIILSIASNNILFGIPLTMNMVGISSQEYYVTFGKELWIGRIILLAISIVLFKIGIKYFENNWKKEK